MKIFLALKKPFLPHLNLLKTLLCFEVLETSKCKLYVYFCNCALYPSYGFWRRPLQQKIDYITNIKRRRCPPHRTLASDGPLQRHSQHLQPWKNGGDYSTVKYLWSHRSPGALCRITQGYWFVAGSNYGTSHRVHCIDYKWWYVGQSFGLG